ncbi:MAG: helix-turn-helix transcriptional regulator [Planctomycetes bacterium]|nr:helix-turn-helix transcriptional regulator [Planctomycetota bacterium]
MLRALQIKLSSWCGVGLFPKGAALGPRKIPDFEFVWMIEGSARYREGDREFEVPEGSIVLCKPRIPELFQWDRQRRSRHGYFHFEIVRAPQEWPPVGSWPVVRTPADGDVLRPLFRHVLTWNQKGSEAMRHFTAAYILAAFISGEVNTAELPGGMSWPEPVVRAWNHICATLNEKPDARITLSALARAACVSQEYLCRLFETFVRHSPVETVRLFRMERAAWIMMRSNYSIGQVADLFGYSDQFHFSRRFRQAYGMPPKEFLRKVRNGNCPAPPSLVSGTPPGLLAAATGRGSRRKA